MKKYDIVALGEILIDYTPMKNSENGMKVFEQNAGGAPANVLASSTKFGAKTAFIGKIGTDMQGEFLRQTLIDANIETKGLISDKDYFTTLAFVTLSENGERSFAFSRKHSADINLSKEEVDISLIEDAKIFHFGSLSLTHNKNREATLFAIEKAKKTGALISYDPNYRALLWENEEVASEIMKSVIEQVDILKISDEETVLMTGEKTPENAMKYLLSKGVPVVAITLGENGTLIGNSKGFSHVKGFKADKVVDTTGAGDTFWGSVLFKIVDSKKNLNEISLEELEKFAEFANAAASLCVTKRGAISSMPTMQEVANLGIVSSYTR